MFYILILFLIIGIVEWRNRYININVKVDPEKDIKMSRAVGNALHKNPDPLSIH